MQQEKLFTDFLTLAYMYFREEKNAEFYAERLKVSPETLKTSLEEFSGIKFEDWLDNYEKKIP